MDANYYKQYEPIFGSWHITRLIGEGSFGTVFEIEREDFGVTYKAALKAITVPSGQSEVNELMASNMDEASVKVFYESFVKDLVQEFSLMSRLKGNSNIVSYENHYVYEHKDGVGWDILIQMELLTPLNQYIRTRQITPKDVIRLGIHMCRALELCQKQNIIHRDVKPENMFISDAGDFKLGDFGVAKIVEKTTMGLSKKGTFTYMAPEVYRGQPYGTTVDIYSLGIVMYRLLNDNRTPFLPAYPTPIAYSDRENSLIQRMSGVPMPDPSHGDERLHKIVKKACAYNAKDRYQTPQQMRRDLEAVLYNRKEDETFLAKIDASPQIPASNQGYQSEQILQTSQVLQTPYAQQKPRKLYSERTVNGFNSFSGKHLNTSPYPTGNAYIQQATSPQQSDNHITLSIIAAIASAAAVVVALICIVMVFSGSLFMHSGTRKGNVSGSSDTSWSQTITYNENGTEATVTSYDSNKNQSGYVELVYNSSGKLTQGYTYDPEDGVVSSQTYDPDEDEANQSGDSLYWKELSEVDSVECVYDGSTLTDVYYFGGSHDSQDSYICWESYELGYLTYSTYRLYNEDDTCTKEDCIAYNQDGSFESRLINIYTDDETQKSYYHYDQDGYPDYYQISRYQQDGEVDAWYDYDGDGVFDYYEVL